MQRFIQVCCLALACSSAVSENAYRYSDGHVHVVDFFQGGEPLAELLVQMDAGNVSDAMIAGVPLMKKWHEDEPKRPRYYAGDDAGMYWFSATDAYLARTLESLTAAQRSRLHPFLSGFNPTDKNADNHLRRMLELYPDTWQGIGEVFTRHDDLTALTQDDTPRANNEAMHRVYEFAREHDFPVLLHSNITSKRERNPLYVGELEGALEKHPGVRIIWAHAGTSKTLHRYQGKMEFLLPTLRKLLAKYGNLYIDLSWTVLHPYLLDKADKPVAAWVELVSEYPDRFILGSDVLGSYKNLGRNLQEFEPFLEALPAEVARKLARENFLALLPAPERGDHSAPALTDR